VYTAPGTYQVSLTVTDENGLSNTASASITVNLQLEGVVWVLDDTLPDTSITAEFGNGGISGSAGCNTYTGNVSTTRAAGPSNAMSIDGLITTQMACEEPVMTQEQTYLTALSSAQSYTIASSTLTIAFTGGMLTYQAQP
jgi:heat shock protein HslJ